MVRSVTILLLTLLVLVANIESLKKVYLSGKFDCFKNDFKYQLKIIARNRERRSTYTLSEQTGVVVTHVPHVYEFVGYAGGRRRIKEMWLQITHSCSTSYNQGRNRQHKFYLGRHRSINGEIHQFLDADLTDLGNLTHDTIETEADSSNKYFYLK